MSLPNFSTQAELFSTAGLSAALFAETDRYRLFARLVYPRLAAARAALEPSRSSRHDRRGEAGRSQIVTRLIP